MYEKVKLDSLRIFHVAALHLSFKRAAEELALTPTAVSHRIASLEEQLGMPLFHRATRQVSLTNEGLSLFQATARAFPILSDAIDEISKYAAPSTVVLSATTAFAQHWLIPRVGQFSKIHPDIILSIRADNGVANVAAGEADIAIRYGAIVPQKNLHLLKLGSDHFVPACSPAYWTAVQTGQEKLRLIHYHWQRKDKEVPNWGGYGAPLDAHAIKVQNDETTIANAENIYLSDEISAVSTALAGQGIALLSDWLIHDHLANASLIRPYDERLAGFDYHLVMRDEASRSARALKDWLISQFKAFEAIR